MLLYQKPTRTIQVSQEDMDGGERGHPANCMMARAIQRQTGIPCLVSHVGMEVWVDKRTKVLHEWPGEITAKIRAWDNGFDVEPFSFPLDIPELSTDYAQSFNMVSL